MKYGTWLHGTDEGQSGAARDLGPVVTRRHPGLCDEVDGGTAAVCNAQYVRASCLIKFITTKKHQQRNVFFQVVP